MLTADWAGAADAQGVEGAGGHAAGSTAAGCARRAGQRHGAGHRFDGYLRNALVSIDGMFQDECMCVLR